MRKISGERMYRMKMKLKVCSMRGTSLAHVIREIKGKHFIVNVSREFNSPESF